MKTFHRRHREQGSAMLFALMGLVFLTVIGLSLAVVTETEMIIGSNEQIAQETFFAAEAGVAAAVGQLLVENNMKAKHFALLAKYGLDEDGEEVVRTAGGLKLGYAVDFTTVYPVAQGPAAYTQANQGDNGMQSLFFVTTVRARRLAWPAEDPHPWCDDYEEVRDIGFGLPSGDPGTPGDDGYDEFANVLAEKEITLGFFVSPLGQLTNHSEGFKDADNFGCDGASNDRGD